MKSPPLRILLVATGAVIAVIAVVAFRQLRQQPAPAAQTVSSLTLHFADAGQPDGLLRLNAWMYHALSSDGKKRNVTSPDEAINEETVSLLDAQCGHRAMLVEEVFRRAALPSRRLAFFGIPGQLGHAAIEVLIAGEWRFVDPTFGLYFAAPEDPWIPLSLATARARYPRVQIMAALPPGWTGRWIAPDRYEQRAPSALYRAIPAGIVHHPHVPQLPIADIERTYFASEYAHAGSEPVLRTLYFDLGAAPRGQVGACDQDATDLVGEGYMVQMPYGRVHAPLLPVVGHNRAGLNVGKSFAFLVASARQVELQIDFVAPVAPEARRALLMDTIHPREFGIDKVMIDRQWPSASALRLVFLATPPATTLRLWFSEQAGQEFSLWIDALRWSSN